MAGIRTYRRSKASSPRSERARERYRTDPIYREEVKRRTRARYEHKPARVKSAVYYHKARNRLLSMSTQPNDAWRRAVRRDPCPYCGCPSDGTSHSDHIQPRASGGSNSWENRTGACESCNCQKNDRSLLLYLLYRRDLAYLESLREEGLLEVSFGRGR